MIFGNLSLLLVVGLGVQRAQDPHGLVISGLGLENLLKALCGVLHVASVDVHLAQAEVRKNEVGRCELCSLVNFLTVIISMSLMSVLLNLIILSIFD